jgi:autotransporter translocation and assembly factor TamB
MWKWIRRLVVASGLLLVLLAMAGVLVFRSDWLRDRLRRAAVTQADKYLTGQLTIGALKGSLLHGVELDDVTLTQADGAVFSAARVDVTYDVMTLIHRHLVLSDIVVDHPDIRVAQTAAGWNVGHIVKPRDAKGTSLDFEIHRLRVVDGDVRVVPMSVASRHLETVTADLSVFRSNGVVSMVVTSGALHDDTSGYDVTAVAGSLKDSLKTIGVQFAATRLDAKLGGHADLASQTDGLHVQAAVDLVHVNLRSFLLDPKWQSDVTAHANVQGLVTTRADETLLAFDVTSPQAAAFGYAGEAIAAKGQWAKGLLTFNASANGYGASATMTASWQVVGSAAGEAAFQASGAFAHAALPKLPPSLKIPPLESNLAGRYHVQYGQHVLHANVVLEQSTVEGGTVAAGTVGYLTLRPGLTTYAGTGTVNHMDLRRLAGPLAIPSLGADRYRSTLSGDFSISGQELCRNCDVPRIIIASAKMASGTFAGADVRDATGTMALIGSRLSVVGSGQVAHLSAEALGIPLSSTFDLNGHVTGTFVMTDLRQTTTVSNVEASGTAELGPSTIAGVAVDAATGDASLANGILTASTVKAQGAGLKASGTGTLALGETGESAFDVLADSDDLNAFGTLIGQPLAGAGRIEAHVTGPFNQPAATGKVTLQSPAYGSDVSALTFNADLTATIPEWDPAQANVSATGSASFVVVKTLAITQAAATVKYHDRHLDLDADLNDSTRELKIAGALAFEANDRALQVNALSLTTKGQTWALPSGQAATIRASTARLDVQGLVLQKGPTSLSADGEYSLTDTPTAGAGLKVKVEALQLADVSQLLLSDRQLSGVVNADVTVTGTTADPAVQGHVSVTSGKIQTTPFESFSGDLRVASHELTLDATLVQSGANTLKATGHVPVGAGALNSSTPMEVKITSTPIDLGLTQVLTDSISNVSGTGQVNLTLTGSPQAPLVDGTIAIAKGKFLLAGTGVNYDQVTAGLTFQKNHLQIDALELHDDDGHLMQAVGGVDVLGDPTKRAFDVKITTRGIHVLHNEMGTLQLNADIEVSGDFAAPKIAGQVTLDSGRLQVDQILERTTKSAYSTTAQAGLTAEPEAPATGGTAVSASGSTETPKATEATASAAPKGLFERVLVDLNVNLPDNLVMRGRGLRIGTSSIGLGDINVIAGGQMRVVKTAGGAPNVVGDVQIVRGTYSFQGKRFDVERGSAVGFHGDDVSDPTLDVSADRDVNGINATVHVRGTAKRPDINLTSQPPLDQAEILSLIIFGQQLGDLGQSQRNSLATSAGAMAAGTLTTPLADSVAEALDLDTFEILAPSDTETLPVVSLGSTIGSRVYVGVKRELGGDASAVSFEYRFTRFLRLVTSFAQGALQAHALERTEAGGIDLLFVFRY